ncbi:nitroreductase/quinone reductase family protein [Nocardia lasii]|uniref:Nitroreductase/quinone reductase family protein n=1 Tax=Nocardia lasii TaxID=1616107 RepID=A0ABW1JS44_9NOCA
MSAFNDQVIAEFRANGGRVGGPFAGRDTMVIITTTGAKSGRAITNPLVFLPDGDRIVLIASNGGADKHPAWYYNLLADPTLTVEVPGETYTGKAELVAEPERTALYDRMVALIPGFGEYRDNTDREIPVFAVYRTN